MREEDENMAATLANLDARFDTEEMITASDLQEKSVTKLQKKIESHHKLLLTLYNRPVGVLLDLNVFKALLRRLEELEETLEALEAANFINQRLAQNVPEEHWASQEQFLKATRSLQPGQKSAKSNTKP